MRAAVDAFRACAREVSAQFHECAYAHATGARPAYGRLPGLSARDVGTLPHTEDSRPLRERLSRDGKGQRHARVGGSLHSRRGLAGPRSHAQLHSRRYLREDWRGPRLRRCAACERHLQRNHRTHDERERANPTDGMKLISWNVNGLRAVLRKNFLEFLEAEKPDVLCLQETKCSPDDVEQLWTAHYTTHWNCAEKKGYAGTATFSRTPPLKATQGISMADHDREGRVLT